MPSAPAEWIFVQGYLVNPWATSNSDASHKALSVIYFTK